VYKTLPLDGLMIVSADKKLRGVEALTPGKAVLIMTKGRKLDTRFLELFRDDALILVDPQQHVAVPPAAVTKPVHARPPAPEIAPKRLPARPPPPPAAN
jgi:hypothetical protein